MATTTARPTTTKLATLDAMFPELTGGNIYKAARGRGTTRHAAIARAVRALLTQPGVRGKRISTFKVTVSLADVPTEE